MTNYSGLLASLGLRTWQRSSTIFINSSPLCIDLSTPTSLVLVKRRRIWAFSGGMFFILNGCPRRLTIPERKRFSQSWQKVRRIFIYISASVHKTAYLGAHEIEICHHLERCQVVRYLRYLGSAPPEHLIYWLGVGTLSERGATDESRIASSSARVTFRS